VSGGNEDFYVQHLERSAIKKLLREVALASHRVDSDNPVRWCISATLTAGQLEESNSMFKTRLRRELVKRRHTTIDSRRLDREAAERHEASQPASREQTSDLPRFGVRPSRH
jgi:hypothetical protein